tara:strand:- start:121 stop:303 length:183 start_codon:yes stop_codon:yes gene_type:complete
VIKKALIFIFILVAMIVVLNLSKHNVNRSINACVEEKRKISTNFDREEAIIICEEKLNLE